MELEDELRQAMAEHVTGVSAPRTLAHEARRRHQRTVRRRATIAVAAAGVVVAIAVIPTYQAVRPQPVSAPGPEGRHTGGGGATTSGSAAPSPSTAHGGGSTAPSASPSARTHAETRPSRHPGAGGSHGTVPDAVKALPSYLPEGIDPHDTCHTGATGARRTTTCRWTGPVGWIEVRLVRDATLKEPGDMGFTPPSAQHAKVHGHAALRATAGATFGQVTWIERSGLGVWVGVSPTLGARLMKIAEGVRVG
ncbi:hypothetical protein NE235_29905 [Actinoallomurus spadix]|uniref:DUF4367 domain-containing protein n=1 Tax=Actinoallomurus spadix TaxID=79912 RepID=A0ABP3G3D8_9ACTN|nr:hypothetical protein [Actinoallomurus spadix]MCO5990334.1 hypothetical protein [Actinoallomurus spadix]